MVPSPCFLVYTSARDRISSVSRRCALFIKTAKALISLESLTVGSMINKSLIVGLLIINVSTVGPLGADSLVADSLISDLLAGSFGLLGLPAPLLVPYIAT
jgi:hypothetical protein